MSDEPSRREPHPSIKPILDQLDPDRLNRNPEAVAALQRISRLLASAREPERDDEPDEDA